MPTKFTTVEQAGKLTKEQVFHMLQCAEACLEKQSSDNARLRDALQIMVEQAGCYMDDGEATPEEQAAMFQARSALSPAMPTCADLDCPCLQEQGGGK